MNKASKLYKYPIGAIFYKKEKDNDGNNIFVLLRLYKVKSKNTFLLRDKQNNKVVLSKKQLDEFTMLEPDGLIVHVLASDPQQGIDTLCLLYRSRDIDNNITEPYAVCRQNIIDPFETLLNNDKSTIIVGVSMSKDTAPVDFDYKSLCLAAGVRDQKIHFVYKDDNLDDILSFVNEDLYDKALNIIKSHMTDIDSIKYKGFCDSYRSLLLDNDFMYDFRRAFGIIRVKLSINTSINSWTEQGIYKITTKEINILESLTKHVILNPILIKYDYSIDLSEIRRTYILFEDLNNDIYIISYDKGEYINREYDALDDKRDKDLLLNVIHK